MRHTAIAKRKEEGNARAGHSLKFGALRAKTTNSALLLVNSVAADTKEGNFDGTGTLLGKL